MTSKPRSLLDHRLIIVTGKGGVGKTTVACLLAEAARRAGQRVLLAETAPIEAVAARFERHPAPLGYEGRELRPGLHAIRIDPHEALAHYVRLQTGLGLVTDRILASETFQQLLEAAPGWRELILLGKLWHAEQSLYAARPVYDLIVVDAPATGHGLTFLDVPRVAQQAVRAGPLARHAGWVEELVHDRERTLLLPVTLPEELPARETVELVTRAREELDIGVDRIVVNRCPPRPNLALAKVLAESKPVFEAWPPGTSIVPLVEHAAARAALAARERARVSDRCALPVVDLPILPGGAEGGSDLSAAADGVLADPSWPDREQSGASAA
ncbi:MAG: ArsA family ATPase [Myxococcota bacterium]